MSWYFRASLDSDPDITIASRFGKRKSSSIERFIGKLVLEQREPMTIQGWKRPKAVDTWSVHVEDDGSFSPPPDTTIRIVRAD